MVTMAVRPPSSRSLAASNCDGVALMRAQVQQVHQLLEERVVAAAQRTRSSPVLQRQVLSVYAHCICIEDVTINVLLRDMPPVFKHMWVGGRLEPWGLMSLQAYAQRVHTATYTLLAGLAPAELGAGIDLSEAGLGLADTAWLLNRFILCESAMTCGTLSVMRPRPTARRSRSPASQFVDRHAYSA